MGYTRDELVEIANKNNKIKRALRMAVDSLIDKVFFCVTAEYFNPDFADFLLIYYLKNFDFVKNDKVIDINFGGGKLLNEKN